MPDWKTLIILCGTTALASLPPAHAADDAFVTPKTTARFLAQATFGPRPDEISRLAQTSASAWFLDQLQEPPNYLMPFLLEYRQNTPEAEEEVVLLENEAATFGFWRNAIVGRDQLRQRMAFALSELLVVSNSGGGLLTDIPDAVVYYQDLLIEHAFGNYRDLLEAVTYAPAMGHYLTYMGNEKGDLETGRVPDENYAREIMQLFTIGLLELNADGTPRTDTEGQPLETYNNEDVTGLARVFTGLNIDKRYFDGDDVEDADGIAFAVPMVIYPDSHSDRPKQFLGTSIAANTPGKQSIDAALDHLFAHPNVAPFVGRQLIQRFVTSHPTRGYTKRVASTFERGRYTLPDGTRVGTGRRGDLTATLAAILFDHQARNPNGRVTGKVREPILRMTHWARAFRAKQVTPEYSWALWDTSEATALGQHPYRAPSVFNFFRPGYVAPGTLTGSRNLTAPELQIVNASSVPGYANFMTPFIFNEARETDVEELQEEYDEEGLPLNAELALTSFEPNYSREIQLANNSNALLNRLDIILTHGQLSGVTRAQIKRVLAEIPPEDNELRELRVMFAVMMIMTSPDYLVIR